MSCRVSESDITVSSVCERTHKTMSCSNCSCCCECCFICLLFCCCGCCCCTAVLALSRSSQLNRCVPLVADVWTFSVCSSSRTSSAALVAARHVRRRPRAVRNCGPLSTRIHQAFLHHVPCLFDTLFTSCIEFVSFFFASTHSSCVVVSPSSCSPWACTSLLFFLPCSSSSFLSPLFLLFFLLSFFVFAVCPSHPPGLSLFFFLLWF